MTAPIGSHEKHIVLIPTWVRDVVKRHGCDAKTILSYHKLRQIMNDYEIAIFLASQAHLASSLGINVDDYLLQSWKQTCSNEEQQVELDSTTVVQANDTAVKSELAQRFLNGSCPDEKAWQVADLSREVCAIYVAPGFLANLSIDDNEITFHRDIVSLLHKWQTDEAVAMHGVFKRYVALLEATV